jgi:hypothetical protein
MTNYTERNADADKSRDELMWALMEWIEMPWPKRAALLSIVDEGYCATEACPYDTGTPERAAWIVGADRSFRDNK